MVIHTLFPLSLAWLASVAEAAPTGDVSVQQMELEDLPPMPTDLHKAVEAMRSAILHHQRSGWRDIRRDDVLAVLSALKQLALAR